MARLHETLETTLPLERAFAFIADFSNQSAWDPGTAWSKAVGDPTPRIGAKYLLGVRIGRRVTPMEYEITGLLPNARVVLAGTGSNIEATDDIRFERTANGTRIDYRAEIELRGWMRLLAPVAGSAFASIGRAARDGMQRTLDRLDAEQVAA
jgi:carbon monoxide dehydrogenase subunit G